MTNKYQKYKPVESGDQLLNDQNRRLIFLPQGFPVVWELSQQRFPVVWELFINKEQLCWVSEWPPAEPTLLCLQTSNYFFSFSVLVFVNITRPTNFNILFFFSSSYLDWSLSTLLWLQTWFTKFFSSYHRVLCCSHIMSGAGGVEGQEPPNLGHTHEKHIPRNLPGSRSWDCRKTQILSRSPF